jgi:hypothetical protein
LSETSSGWRLTENQAMLSCNEGYFRLIGWMVVDLFRSRAALEAEIWRLGQQINVLRWTATERVSISIFDRWVFVGRPYRKLKLVPVVPEAGREGSS